MTTGDLFDVGKVHSVEYTSISTGTPGIATLKVQNIGTITYHGIQANHVKWDGTLYAEGRKRDVLVEMYQNPADGSLLGGHLTVRQDSQLLVDQDLTSTVLKQYSPVASSATSGTPLVGMGPETVTAGGKTYDCVRYSATGPEGTSYYWVTTGVPFPVRFQMPDNQGNATTELTSWS